MFEQFGGCDGVCTDIVKGVFCFVKGSRLNGFPAQYLLWWLLVHLVLPACEFIFGFFFKFCM